MKRGPTWMTDLVQVLIDTMTDEQRQRIRHMMDILMSGCKRMVIKEQVLNIEIKMEELEQQYRNNLASLREELRDVRENCPHDSRTYHPDPSGNNDSCYTCDACGKEMKR